MSVEIPIVNKYDEIVGYRTRGEVVSGETYRITSLTLVNSLGQLLIAQRALCKQNDPGKWGPAVAGTVERGETYASNIRKEDEEELGLNEIALQTGPMLHVSDNGNGRGYFCQMYIASVDRDADSFVLQADEVAAVKWVDLNWLVSDVTVQADNYTINFAEGLDLILPHLPVVREVI